MFKRNTIHFSVSILFLFSGGATPGDAHRLLLALRSGITPGRLGGLYGMTSIESGSTVQGK